MANTNTYVLPKLLAQGVLAAREQSILPRLVNRDYESMAAQRGATINIPIPSSITARAVTAAVTIASNQDFSPTAAVVTLDQWYEASFQLSDKDAMDVMDGIIPMQASEAIRAVVNAADQYIAALAGYFVPVGTAATTPFATTINVMASAVYALDVARAPSDGRFGVINPAAKANLMVLGNLIQFYQKGDQTTIVKGQMGELLGINWFMDQNTTSHTNGTGWATGYTASTVGVAVADTTINIINTTASGTVLVGDMFASGAGFYTITAAATAVATTQFAVTFYPAMATAVATGAAVTVLAAHVKNLVAHRDAIAFASRPLADAVDGNPNIISAPTDPVSGLALRLERSRQYKQTTYSFDLLWGAAKVRQGFGVQLLG